MSRASTGGQLRTCAPCGRLDHHNLFRPHLGIGDRSPISRVDNAAGQYDYGRRTGSVLDVKVRGWIRHAIQRIAESTHRAMAMAP
jgi:hypothetical protein